MEVDGFRWAPQSFMAKAFRRGVAKKALGTEVGLNMQCPGIKFSGNTMLITPEQSSYTMLITPPGNRWEAYQPRTDNLSDLEKGVEPFVMALGIQKDEEDEVILDWSVYHPSKYAIILEEPLLTSENDDGYSHAIYGAIVSIYHEEGDTLSVRYIEQVTIIRGIIMPSEEDEEEKGAAVKARNDLKLKSIAAPESRNDISTMPKGSDFDKTFGVLMRNVNIEQVLLTTQLCYPQTRSGASGRSNTKTDVSACWIEDVL